MVLLGTVYWKLLWGTKKALICAAVCFNSVREHFQIFPATQGCWRMMYIFCALPSIKCEMMVFIIFHEGSYQKRAHLMIGLSAHTSSQCPAQHPERLNQKYWQSVSWSGRKPPGSVDGFWCWSSLTSASCWGSFSNFHPLRKHLDTNGLDRCVCVWVEDAKLYSCTWRDSGMVREASLLTILDSFTILKS